MNTESLIGHIVQPSRLKQYKANPDEAPEKVVLESDAFENGMPIPAQYSADGGNVSPPLHWSEAPKGTREWLLICEDPDAPREVPFVHWVISLPELFEGLSEGASGKDLPRGAREALNDANTIGYYGPRPPEGHGVHHYHFQLFAIDKKLDLSETSNRSKILASIEGHVVGFAELIGTFETKRGR